MAERAAAPTTQSEQPPPGRNPAGQALTFLGGCMVEHGIPISREDPPFESGAPHPTTTEVTTVSSTIYVPGIGWVGPSELTMHLVQVVYAAATHMNIDQYELFNASLKSAMRAGSSVHAERSAAESRLDATLNSAEG